MKIALLDLNHTTCGRHSNTIPLAVGLIAAYLKKNMDPALDIRLFKEADKALDTFKSWIPDVLGVTQYCWNSELNLYVARLVKALNPNCTTIAGGPNLGLSVKEKDNFLKVNNFIDICVAYDGEIPFAEVVRRLLVGEPTSQIKKKPSAGTYSLNPETNELVISPEKPPRISSLNVFGALYTEGFFDEFLKDGYHPFIQTHRGCPFTCAYCNMSDLYHSRMLFLSPEDFRKDMEYLGRFFTGRHEIQLCLGNTNMGLFDQDFEIAKIIRETQEKYDWPKLIVTGSGKDPKKLLDMLSIINFQPAIALQTLTPHVLKNIRRVNISLEEYCAFQEEVLRRTGETSETDLILSLPEETKETFLDTLRKVMNSGVQNIVIYTLMHLKGTPLATEEADKAYGHVLRHRVVPRQFSTINGQKIFDSEEVVISTNHLPFKDYLELRGICFTVISFFGSTELIPLKRFMLEYKLDLAEWVFNLHAQLKAHPDLYQIYRNFLKETEEELFLSREALIDFYSQPQNYNDLLTGKRGDNLIRKYKCITISENYKAYLTLAVSEAKKLACQKLGREKADQLLGDLAKYLSTRDIRPILAEEGVLPTRYFNLNYDVPSWISHKEGIKLLEEFGSAPSYKVEFTTDTKQKLNNFLTANKDKNLSLQFLYLGGGNINSLWPWWIPQNKEAIPEKFKKKVLNETGRVNLW